LAISKKRLEEIEAIKDEDIDCSDIPELDEDFWANAELRLPKPKKGVYLRIDQDILDRLKAEGPGYQTRINAVLRAYLDAKSKA
jgi:uncharacterized protein (DUF4415 family)